MTKRLLIELARKYTEHELVRKDRRVNIIMFIKFPNVPKMIRIGGIIRLSQNEISSNVLLKLVKKFDIIR